MRYILSAFILTLAGALDELASHICKERGIEFVVFTDLDEITQALTPPSAIGELPGIDIQDQVDQLLEGVVI